MTEITQTGQMTRAEMLELYAQRRYDDIAQARAEGRLDQMLGMPLADIETLHRGRTADNLTPADIEALTRLRRHDLIAQAAEQGRIDYTTAQEG